MKKIYLIDGNSFIYRMFFGLPEFSTKDGKIVNAIFGMAKFFVDTLIKEKPDYLLFIKDAKGDNFRHKIYADYKSTRDRMPDNLRSQISDIEKMIKMMKIDIIEVDGYEADDVIGTLAHNLGQNKNNNIYILSSDKDLYSLIKDNVFLYDTMKKKIFNPEKTKEKFGVSPSGIIDYLSIVGDKADNIPGIDGFGPKKAIDLINIIGSIEKIYSLIIDFNFEKLTEKERKKILLEQFGEENTKKIFGCFKGKTFEKLLISKEDSFLSKKLATIELNIDLDKNLLIDDYVGNGIVNKKFKLESFIFKGENYLNENIKEYFKKLEFFSLLGKSEEIKLKKWNDLKLKIQVIKNKVDLNYLFKNIEKSSKIIINTEATSLNIIEAKFIGMNIFIDSKNIYYIDMLNLNSDISNIDLKIFLKNILELNILIIGHNIKYDLEIIDCFLGKTYELKNKNNNLKQISLL